MRNRKFKPTSFIFSGSMVVPDTAVLFTFAGTAVEFVNVEEEVLLEAGDADADTLAKVGAGVTTHRI